MRMNIRILSGSEIVVGGIISILSESRIVDMMRLISRKGKRMMKLMVKVMCNLLSMKVGVSCIRFILFVFLGVGWCEIV